MTKPAIRSLETVDEYQACVELQEEVWGRNFSEKVPLAILKVSRRLGGVVGGAFSPQGKLQGFVFGMTGWEDRRPVHWSDMLAVRPEARGRGLGMRLKAFQREEMLAAGVDTVYWTFDPLVARNGHLNLARLGAVARSYEPNMYGFTGSDLHGGLPTDRLVVTWSLAAPRVEARLRGRESPPVAEDVAGLSRVVPVEGGAGAPVPGLPRTGLDDPELLIPIPLDFNALLQEPDGARRWREATRQAFTDLLSRGYEVRELVRRGTVADYLLVRKERA